MRRSVIGTFLIVLAALLLVVSGSMPRGFAQTTNLVPQGDEFANGVFTAPFHVTCSSLASPACSTGDPQSATTWSLTANPGFLRIMTQFGSLLGTGVSASNNARNLVLQPFAPNYDWTVTTKLTFPGQAGTNPTALGQTAGLLVYQDDDNFIYVARTFNPQATAAQLVFVQEIAGIDAVTTFNEGGVFFPTVYLRITKAGTSYQAFYSYDNLNFSPINAGPAPGTLTPTATATATGTPVTPTLTPVPTAYVASYTNPQVGLFAFGGTNTQVTNYQLAADFDWFRVGVNSMTPAPTATAGLTATSTTTATATTTTTAVPAATSTATATPTATATATAAATATATVAPTNTPIPTPTPKPKPKKITAAFKYIQVWYHVVHEGTFNHIAAQGTHSTTYGIWVHVWFPYTTGLHYDWFTNTNSKGFWGTSFPVPRAPITAKNDMAIVTFRLWKGKSNRADHTTFVIHY